MKCPAAGTATKSPAAFAGGAAGGEKAGLNGPFDLFEVWHPKCYSFAMNPITVSDVLDLPIQDRIQLVEAIWDSIAEVPEAVSLSDTQRSELDKRLAAFQECPAVGSPWSEVRARILNA